MLFWVNIFRDGLQRTRYAREFVANNMRQAWRGWQKEERKLDEGNRLTSRAISNVSPTTISWILPSPSFTMRYTNKLDNDYARYPQAATSPARLHVSRVTKLSLPPSKTVLSLGEKETGTSFVVEARQVHVFRFTAATPARARRRRPTTASMIKLLTLVSCLRGPYRCSIEQPHPARHENQNR